MSTEAIAAIDADLARVASAQLHLAAAHADEVPIGRADPSRVEHGHAAVASAEATLAAAEAALAADRASRAPDPTAQAAPQTGSASPASNHIVDVTA